MVKPDAKLSNSMLGRSARDVSQARVGPAPDGPTIIESKARVIVRAD